MSSVWIKSPECIWLGGTSPNSNDARGGIVVRDGVIDEHLALGAQPSHPVTDVFDASNKIVIPGLINCHHHFYQTLTRALPAALNKELFDWLINL